MQHLSHAVGAVLAILQDQENFLLVRRANPPDQGLWGFPGGRIEPGEALLNAASRELLEETGIVAVGQRIVTTFDSIHFDHDGALQFHYIVVAVVCTGNVTSQSLLAGDDALEAKWFSVCEIKEITQDCSPGLLDLIEKTTNGPAGVSTRPIPFDSQKKPIDADKNARASGEIP